MEVEAGARTRPVYTDAMTSYLDGRSPEEVIACAREVERVVPTHEYVPRYERVTRRVRNSYGGGIGGMGAFSGGPISTTSVYEAHNDRYESVLEDVGGTWRKLSDQEVAFNIEQAKRDEIIAAERKAEKRREKREIRLEKATLLEVIASCHEEVAKGKEMLGRSGSQWHMQRAKEVSEFYWYRGSYETSQGWRYTTTESQFLDESIAIGSKLLRYHKRLLKVKSQGKSRTPFCTML